MQQWYEELDHDNINNIACRIGLLGKRGGLFRPIYEALLGIIMQQRRPICDENQSGDSL
jgi:hypothetical protein